MIIRYRGWQGIAAVVLSFSSTPLWAQLPSPKMSPLNQLGRTLGFGISDGYHECAESKNRPTFARTPTPATTVSHTMPCVDCEKKPSFFSRINPFNESMPGGDSTSCGSGVCGPASSGRMIVLPPSQDMYQQFAAPHETPLPGSNSQPLADLTPANPTTPSNSGHPLPEAFPPSLGSPVPDPLELNSLESPLLQSDSTQAFQPDTVPPPPVLRKLQKGDKSLNEDAEPKLPREPVPANPTDEKPQNKSDESLDLLPKDEPPPITIHPQTKSGRSLISHTTTIPDSYPARPAFNSHEVMLRQYYGQAYARQEPPVAEEVRVYSPVATEPPRATLNRYR